jgi:hypothetical protein
MSIILVKFPAAPEVDDKAVAAYEDLRAMIKKRVESK